MIEMVEEAVSTQDVLMARAEAGEAETALLARRQTAGHGRLGRLWVSREGNLHLSLLVRPGTVRWPGHWSLLAGVALVEALEALAPGRSLRLKWPNDVLLDMGQGGGKVAGVLVEAGGFPDPWLVVGFGVNLVWAPDALGREVAVLSGVEVGGLAPAVVASFGRWRARYVAEGFGCVRDAWMRRGPADGEVVVGGMFAGLREDGAMLLASGGAVVAG